MANFKSFSDLFSFCCWLQKNYRHDPKIQTIFLKNPEKYLSINNWWYSDFRSKAHFMLPLSDIALINLPQQHALNLNSKNSKPVYLFSPNYLYNNMEKFYSKFKAYQPKAKTALVVGWGYTKYSSKTKSHADNLKKGMIRTETTEECAKHTDRLKYHKNTMKLPDVFCGTGVNLQPNRKISFSSSGSTKGKSFTADAEPKSQNPPQICMGDSGGPIFFKFKKQLVQFGISVWVDDSCQANFNGFLKIDSHINWILENTQDKGNIKILAKQGKRIVGHEYHPKEESSKPQNPQQTEAQNEKLVLVSLDPFGNGTNSLVAEQEDILDSFPTSESDSEDLILDWIEDYYPQNVTQCLEINEINNLKYVSDAKAKDLSSKLCDQILKDYGFSLKTQAVDVKTQSTSSFSRKKLRHFPPILFRNETKFSFVADLNELSYDQFFEDAEDLVTTQTESIEQNATITKTGNETTPLVHQTATTTHRPSFRQLFKVQIGDNLIAFLLVWLSLGLLSALCIFMFYQILRLNYATTHEMTNLFYNKCPFKWGVDFE